MPDVPIKPRPPEEPTLAEQVAPVVEAVTTGARVLLTGSETGAVRRPLLYALNGLGIIMLAVDGPVGLVFGGIAIIALLLLAFTDQWVGS